MSTRAALSHDRNPLPLRTAGLLLMVVFFSVAASGPIREMLGFHGRLQRLEQRAERIEAENVTLRAEIERLRDPAVIEQLARECLGMIREGEQAVVRAGDPADC
ncbi:MAG: FtsB family cell division protein [Actinomycetota bacterium]